MNWGQAITDLVSDSAPLGPKNKPVKKLNKENGAFQGKIASFKDSLASATEEPSVARSIIGEMWDLFKRDKGGSAFPVTLHTTLLEYVNAKLLYWKGDTSIMPGGTVQSENKKGVIADLQPDYFVEGKQSTEEVGDHVRTMSAKSVPILCRDIAAGVKDKLTTYPKLNVRVVVDATTAPAASDLANSSEVDKLITEALKSNISEQLRSRLTRVDVLLGDTVRYLDAGDYLP